MDEHYWQLGLVFFLMSMISFLIMLYDKIQSRKKGAERISEGMLFFMATIFGSAGVLSGMLFFRHKTRKWYFMLGIPLLILQNCAFLYAIYLYFNQGV
jgi:uncharacterized membrane protein YsdA (DUF1294 family)